MFLCKIPNESNKSFKFIESHRVVLAALEQQALRLGAAAEGGPASRPTQSPASCRCARAPCRQQAFAGSALKQ